MGVFRLICMYGCTQPYVVTHFSTKMTRNVKKIHDIEIFLRTKIIIISNVIPTQRTERTTNNNPNSNFFYLTTRINQLHFISIALPTPSNIYFLN